MPSLYPEDFHLPVYEPSFCLAPTNPQSPHLEEGNVVTVEPGIYFSTYALSMFYLHSPIHSKYINVKVLEKYLPVGGVRIEDDILITSKGFRNLTTAPKGEAMLEIIRSQKTQRPFVVDSTVLGPVKDLGVERKTAEKDAEQLRRAPGISKHVTNRILKPIERASTLPVERKDRKSVDFKPFDGPSLFSGFKRASTLDVPSRTKTTELPKTVSDRQRHIAPVTVPQSPMTVCGDHSPEFHHVYMDSLTQMNSFATKFRSSVQLPSCQKCSVLVQTVMRLRKDISLSEPGISKQQAKAQKKRVEKPEVKLYAEPEEMMNSPEMIPRCHSSKELPTTSSSSQQPAFFADRTSILEMYPTHRSSFPAVRNILEQRGAPQPSYSTPEHYASKSFTYPRPSVVQPGVSHDYYNKDLFSKRAETALEQPIDRDDSKKNIDQIDRSWIPSDHALCCAVSRTSLKDAVPSNFEPSLAHGQPVPAVSRSYLPQTHFMNPSLKDTPKPCVLAVTGEPLLTQSELPNGRRNRLEDPSKQLLPRASLPILGSKAPTNPWAGAQNDYRKSVQQPSVILPELLTPTIKTEDLTRAVEKSSSCLACRAKSRPCDRSAQFPCPPCSYCTRHHLICKSPLPLRAPEREPGDLKMKLRENHAQPRTRREKNQVNRETKARMHSAFDGWNP